MFKICLRNRILRSIQTTTVLPAISRAESAKADKGTAEAAQEKPEKIPSRPTAMTPESLRSLWRKCNKCEKPILVQDVKDNLYVCPRCADISGCMRTAGLRC